MISWNPAKVGIYQNQSQVHKWNHKTYLMQILSFSNLQVCTDIANIYTVISDPPPECLELAQDKSKTLRDN